MTTYLTTIRNGLPAHYGTYRTLYHFFRTKKHVLDAISRKKPYPFAWGGRGRKFKSCHSDQKTGFARIPFFLYFTRFFGTFRLLKKPQKRFFFGCKKRRFWIWYNIWYNTFLCLYFLSVERTFQTWPIWGKEWNLISLPLLLCRMRTYHNLRKSTSQIRCSFRTFQTWPIWGKECHLISAPLLLCMMRTSRNRQSLASKSRCSLRVLQGCSIGEWNSTLKFRPTIIM